VGRTLVDDRYELRALAGSGGMADVFLAYDRVLDRDVALKLLKDRYAQDEDFVERFRREARSAAALSSPFIVPVFDRGETEDGAYYIAMEYLPGGTLEDRLARAGRLPSREAVEVAVQVAEALQTAHERGVVHRDVKPGNVLITKSGHTKVTDFGIARAAEATTISKPGDILGSAKYMSPEQAAGGRVGPPSDLYSLGVVLYEMLTGSVPFAVATPADVPAQHAKGPPRRPSEANPEVPEALDGLVLRLLSTSPEDRYGSSAELLGELGRVKNWLPPTATSPHEATTAALGGPIAPAPDPSTSAPPAPAGPGGARSRRAWWIIAAFVALIAVLGVAGWELLRDPGASGDPGAARSAPEEPPKGAQRARSGPKTAAVPAVIGLGAQEARERLAAAGFEVGVRYREGTEEGNGKVLEQSVAGGKEAGEGSKILLTVGKGPGDVETPNLVGLTYPEAENELKQAGLLLGGVKEAPSETVPAGVIMAQDPAAGTTLDPDSYVRLTTSVGPPEVTTYGF
jgi:eukaryotic-like serine/threonine-protein kinase